MQNRNVFGQFGFQLTDTGKGDYKSRIYYGRKIKQEKFFKNVPDLNGMSLDSFVLVETISRSGLKSRETVNGVFNRHSNLHEEKFKKRTEFIKKVINDNPDHFAKFFCIKKTREKFFNFYEYKKAENLKKLYKKEAGYIPTAEDEEKAIELLSKIIECYEILKNNGIIHRNIHPEFLFKDNEKVKLNLFSFNTEEKYIFKSTMENSTNKPPECFTSYTDNGRKATKYSYKFDIWNIGLLFQYLLYGNSNIYTRDKREKKEFNAFGLEGICDLTKGIIDGCRKHHPQDRIPLLHIKNEIERYRKGERTVGAVDVDNSEEDEVNPTEVNPTEVNPMEVNLTEIHTKTNESCDLGEMKKIDYYDKVQLDKVKRKAEIILTRLKDNIAEVFECLNDLEVKAKKLIIVILYCQAKILIKVHNMVLYHLPNKINEATNNDNISKNFHKFLAEIKRDIDNQMLDIEKQINEHNVYVASIPVDIENLTIKIKVLFHDIMETCSGDKDWKYIEERIKLVNQFLGIVQDACSEFVSEDKPKW